MSRNNPNEYLRDLYNENYKTLKKIEEYSRRQKEFLCSWISRINILKMSVLSEPSSISMQLPENFQGHFFRNRKNNCKIHKESQKTPNSQCNPNQC
jgi:hypothetical protein